VPLTPEEPDLGWAVRLSPQEIDLHQAHTDRFQRLATAKNVFLVVLTAWNLLGLVYLIAGLLSTATSRPIVLTAVIWIWLLGDLAIVAIGWLIVRFRNGGTAAYITAVWVQVPPLPVTYRRPRRQIPFE
jgi:hypothetical protein